MLDGDALDTAREIKRPADRVDLLLVEFADPGNHRTLLHGQILIPAKTLEHAHGELRIAVLDLGFGREAALGQKRLAVAFEAKARAEGAAAILHRDIRIVEDMRARMAELRSPPAGPGQAVEITAHFVSIGGRAQIDQIELVLVGHMRLEPLGTLTRIADRPAAAIDLAQGWIPPSALARTCPAPSRMA